MNKKKVILGSIAALVLLTLGAWAFGLFGHTDPAIANLKQIGDQMRNETLPQAQRDQLRGQFRQLHTDDRAVPRHTRRTHNIWTQAGRLVRGDETESREAQRGP